MSGISTDETAHARATIGIVNIVHYDVDDDDDDDDDYVDVAYSYRRNIEYVVCLSRS